MREHAHVVKYGYQHRIKLSFYANYEMLMWNAQNCTGKLCIRHGAINIHRQQTENPYDHLYSLMADPLRKISMKFLRFFNNHNRKV